MGPLLECVQVPLDGIPFLRCVSCTTRLRVTCKLAEGALDFAVYVIDEDIVQYWSQYVFWYVTGSNVFLKHKDFSLDFLSRKIWGSALSFILCCCFEATQPKLGISKKILQSGQNLLCFVCSVNVCFGRNSEGGRQKKMLSRLTCISWTRSPSLSHCVWWESNGVARWSQLGERAPGTCSQGKASGTNKAQYWAWIIPGVMLIFRK